MWNLWDNVDGTIERGYAGLSIFNWTTLPKLQPRYVDYARLLASVGINGHLGIDCPFETLVLKLRL